MNRSWLGSETFVVESDKLYFTWADFDNAVSAIVESLERRGLMPRVSRIYGIPRGGLVLAVALSHRLGLPLTLSLTEVTWKGRTLVVDDISDSGQSLSPFTKTAVCTATIHVVPGTSCVPDIWVFERPKDKWVVYPWETNSERRSNG